MNTVPIRCTGCMTGGHPPSERNKLGDNHYYHPRSVAKVTDLANTSSEANKSVSNPPYNATLSNLEGRDGG